MEQHRRKRIPGAIDSGIASFSDLFFPDLWYTADDILDADGTAVSSWANRTIGGAAITQSTGAAQPLIKTGANGINGHNIVRFDGGNDYMAVAYSGSSLTAFTIMAVVRPLITETAKGIFQWGVSLADTNPLALFQRDSTNVKIYLGAAGAPGYHWTIAHASNATKLYALKYTSGNVWTLEVNGVDQGAAFTGVKSGNQSTVFIGNGYNGYSNSDIGDFAIWGTALSTGDQLSATNYLKTKYGL